jgi:uncharacterized coiled-coil protein SlyX
VTDHESPQEAFTRGRDAGKVDQRLGDHDIHFAAINGSITRLATNVADLALSMQRLIDKFDSSEKTVIATAAALEKADVARRAKSDQSWSPLQRWSTAIGILAALAGLVVLILSKV